MSEPATWGLRHGDDIVPGLTALKSVGGGTAFEAWVAFDERLYAPVVVKVVRPDQIDDASTLAGLDREIDVLARAAHPAIVRAFSHQRRDTTDRPHVVLENIDGPSLSQLLRRHGPLPLEQLLPLAIELCSALHHLRRVGLTHLDVKPSNVIMGAPARLIDLSVARDVTAARALDHPIGSDEYMAPEQCDPVAHGGVGPEADMWGLGATLFKAVAGYRAFDRGDASAGSGPVRWPQLVDAPYALPDGTPEVLDELVMGCLDADPAARPLPSTFADQMEPLMAALPKARLSGFKISL
ncbi:MAG: serine/threonine-protein kinase [Nocardioidaceae bacterium]|nr:serine/threonine-protein kinase [Nocardioidaceae bacterium]